MRSDKSIFQLMQPEAKREAKSDSSRRKRRNTQKRERIGTRFFRG